MSFTPALRTTRQREIILEELRRVSNHPTADDVYQMVRRRLPSVSLGTVYRNLEMLSAHRLIQKLEHGSAKKRFDGNVQTHYHVRCQRCGRLDDVPIEPLIDLEERLRGVCGYEILGHRLEFIGLCPRCRE